LLVAQYGRNEKVFSSMTSPETVRGSRRAAITTRCGRGTRPLKGREQATREPKGYTPAKTIVHGLLVLVT
jgi:hypothetical protein